jgi:hypothetical protein
MYVSSRWAVRVRVQSVYCETVVVVYLQSIHFKAKQKHVAHISCIHMRAQFVRPQLLIRTLWTATDSPVSAELSACGK